MNDTDNLIESLKRKHCTVVARVDGYHEVRVDGQYGDQCWILRPGELQTFAAGFNMAFHMMAKRHKEFVAMMRLEDVS